MSRVVPAFVICAAALLMAGCAADAPPEPVARRVAPARTKIVTIKQSCTTTIKPENVCAQPKRCYEIETCAEAYYRYTVCGDLSLDGGKGYPRNGIPCQDKCRTRADPLVMADEIIKQPFSPQTRSETKCVPAG
jgi:hypothetical protein